MNGPCAVMTILMLQLIRESPASRVTSVSARQLPLALVERRLVGELGRRQLAFEERPDSVCSGSGRAEQEAAAGRYLEQALRAATEPPETARESPPPPPPEEGQPAAGPARSPPQAAPEPGQKPVRVRTATRPRGGRTAAARAGASPRGRGGVARSGSEGAVKKAEQRTQTRQAVGQVSRGCGLGPGILRSRGDGGLSAKCELLLHVCFSVSTTLRFWTDFILICLRFCSG